MLERREVDTPHGTARILQRRSPRPWATLVLTHGAGGGVDRPDLEVLHRRLPSQGISVVLIEQPWRVAGRRVAPAPRILDEGLAAALRGLRPRTPMILGGRSAGARVACRTGRAMGAVGILALAFPLHPPGRPQRSRAAELSGSGLPTLVIQGELDPMGAPHEFPLGQALVTVPGADHEFRVGRAVPLAPHAALDLVADEARDWIGRRLRRP